MTSTADSQSVEAQDMGTGIWTFWAQSAAPAPAVTTVDITDSLPASKKISECLKRCASDSQCAGVNYAGLTDATDPDSAITSCYKIMTQTTASAGLRSMIKADYSKFSPNMFCPAGQVPKADDSACEACATDFSKPSFAKCVACPTGTFSTEDGTQCKPLAFCPPGKTLGGATGDGFSASSCSSCAANAYKAGAGPAACDACAASGSTIRVNDAFTKCAATAATCAVPLMVDPSDRTQCYIP
jgi:hypothetical protein